MNIDKSSVAEYYNQYSESQIKVGINVRHRNILNIAKINGLKNNHNVLEIGCGIGTVTSLLGKYLTKGRLVSVDISSENVRIAKQFTKKYTNIDILVSDMSDFNHSLIFDFVILPDVLEHIPISQHNNLFSILRKLTHEESVVFINIPNPYSLEYFHEHEPDVLQIIDQPLYTNVLLENIYNNNFYLHSLRTYSLSIKEGDYQAIVIKPYKRINKINKLSKCSSYINEIKSRTCSVI